MIFLALLSTSISLPVQAKGMGDAWIAPVGIVCVSQTPDCSKTELGKQLTELPEYKTGLATFASVASKHPQSASLCEEVISLSPTPSPDLRAVQKVP